MTSPMQNNIILSAAKWAGMEDLSQEQIDGYGYIYEQELNNLLERRRWRFLTDMLPRRAFTATDGDKNLGYTYAYRGPSRVLDVMEIDPVVQPPPVDFERAVDFGYSIPYDYRGGDLASNFEFVGGELYTDKDDWEMAVVQYKVDEVNMPTHFIRALTFKIAAFMAFSDNQNRNKYQTLKKEADEAYIAAQDDLKPRSANDLYETALLKWLDKYNRGMFYL